MTSEDIKHQLITHFDMGYRWHASTHHRSSANMLSHNKTLKWLNKKNREETPKLMKFARKEGKSLRQPHRHQEKLVMLCIKEKLIQNEQKRLETKREMQSKLQPKVTWSGD